jgi:hypothetical protein
VWDTLAKNLNRAASVPRVFVHPRAEPMFASIPPEDVLEAARRVLDLPIQRSFDL